MKALVLSGGASHGAYQAGALRALQETTWEPDLVCGTSVGAINGAGYVSGLNGEEIAQIWRDVSNSDVYSLRPWRDWLKIWKWKHFLDTSPLQTFLRDHLSIDDLRAGKKSFVCFGVKVEDGQMVAYANHRGPPIDCLYDHYEVEEIDDYSILASASIPVVFPSVSGVWDGGVVSNTPLLQAVDMGADEILVITVNRKLGASPTNVIESALRLVDIASSSRFEGDLRRAEEYSNTEVHVVAPENVLPYSRLDFNSPKKEMAVENGFTHTKQRLKEAGYV